MRVDVPRTPVQCRKEKAEQISVPNSATEFSDIMTENQVQEASTPVKLLKSTNAKHSPQVV